MDKVTKITWLISLFVVSLDSLQIHDHDHDHSPPGHKTIDPHKPGPHCWDVSIYTPVDYRPEHREKCHTEFPKKTVPKHDEVCIWAHSVNCSIVPYVECKMTPVKTHYHVTMMVDKKFPVYECKDKPVTHWHLKEIPHCVPVTKKQCITNWVLDPKDNKTKIWSGNEDCHNVTWNDCTLKPTKVEYNATETECKHKEDLEWWDCEKMPKETTTYNMTCEPKAALDCKPVKTWLCEKVYWDESYQEVDEQCDPKVVKVPFQTRKHRKQCILPNEHSKLDTEILKDVKPFDSVPDNQLKLVPGRKRRNARKTDENHGSKHFYYGQEEE